MKMTRAEIEALEPGCEIDRLVAEYVLGQSKPEITHEPDHMGAIDCGAWYCLPDYFRGDICEWTPHAFSNNIAYAWLVVARFDKYEVSTGFGGEHFCELSDYRDGKTLYGSAYADTPAIAICRAGLIAVME